MASLIKEERYVFELGTDNYILRVQELIWGDEPWPQKFRVQLPASRAREAKYFYGATGRETAEATVEYLTSSVSSFGIGARTGRLSN